MRWDDFVLVKVNGKTVFEYPQNFTHLQLQCEKRVELHRLGCHQVRTTRKKNNSVEGDVVLS